MIFKAIIKELPKNDNKYLVRIPPLEDNTDREMILPALLCSQPGEYDGYNVGDVVFVEFENNKLNVPIIIGKLYTKIEDSARGYHKVSKLEVTDSIIIPYTTNFGGYTVKDFFNLYQRAENVMSSGVSYILASDENVIYGE